VRHAKRSACCTFRLSRLLEFNKILQALPKHVLKRVRASIHSLLAAPHSPSSFYYAFLIRERVLAARVRSVLAHKTAKLMQYMVKFGQEDD
jgi:hypothetical protein